MPAVGHVQMSLVKKPGLLQFNGFFHGGVVSGLADHAAGAAATTSLPAGTLTHPRPAEKWLWQQNFKPNRPEV